MLIFGLGELSKVFMIAMIIFFQVLVSSRDFIKTIPDTAFNVIRSFGASRKDEIIKVIIPAALPSLLSSVRVSLGTALSVLFFTENFGTRYGMGYFIMDAWMRVDYVGMYSGIAILGLTGFLLFKALDILERKLCPWHL
jgi:NitT/TauT family transport system permease protein